MFARRPLLVALLGLALLAAMIGTAGATGKHPAVSVSPGVSGAHGHFTVSFHAPVAATLTGFQRTSYVISASTHTGSGCQSVVSHTVYSARKGQLEHVRLGGGSGRLCAGLYRGTVSIMRMARCGPPTQVCPQFASQVSRVGTFRFRVK